MVMKAAYLHKFRVRRKFAGTGMTKPATEAIRAERRNRGVRYIRLGTGPEEKVVRRIYLSVAIKSWIFRIFIALYELEV